MEICLWVVSRLFYENRQVFKIRYLLIASFSLMMAKQLLILL